MDWKCSQCSKDNVASANFCSGCSLAKPKVSKNSNTLVIVGAVLGSLIFACVICGGAGMIMEKTEENEVSEQKTEPTQSPTPTPTPTPTPKPPTFAELKTKGDDLLKEDNNKEFTTEDVKNITTINEALSEINEKDKDYKAAQALSKKLLDRATFITAERITLGKKPGKFDLRPAFNDYLKTRLNDYDSSEYVDYTMPVKVYVKKEPFWLSKLKLRAKNGFGAYIIRDVKVYIRNNKVVLMEGLN